MTEYQEEPGPDFTGLDYSAQGLTQLWGDIRTLLATEGRLCGDEIANKLDAHTYGYQDSSIRPGILPRMRDALSEQGFIAVIEVPGEDDKITKKDWQLTDEVDTDA